MIACFNNSGNVIRLSDHPDGGVVVDALLFYEGDHVDKNRQKHNVSKDRLNLLASNTNVDFNKGLEIPLKFEHHRELVSPSGGINNFGKLASPISCRPIEKGDLANPRLTHLLGRAGAFAQVHVLDRVEDVKKKIIKALSAGIDTTSNKFVEVSAVSDPSLAGAALLFSKPWSGYAEFAHGMTDFQEAWDQVKAWEKPYADLSKRLDVLVGVLKSIEAEENEDEIAFNSNQLKRQAVESFVESIIEYLKIDMEDEAEIESGDIYSQNAYAPSLLKQQSGNSGMNNYSRFDEDTEENILNFSGATEKRTKRRRRGR